MMDIKELKSFVENWLEEHGSFLVELTCDSSNSIVIEFDSEEPVDIEMCVELTRAIENQFSRDEEDYDLEVGSSGLTSPLKLPRQYHKNIGEELEVLTGDGRKLRGLLVNAGAESFTLRIEEKVKREGQKKPVIEQRDIEIEYSRVKRAVREIHF